MKSVIVFLAIVAVVFGDIYMHNPRGSNNRVDQNANAPANRMFDSQNNNEAGYNRGEAGVHMKYYATSQLMVSWTSQHGCGENPINSGCDIIVQRMCSPLIRDGDSTDRPEDNLATRDSEPSADRGRHEPYANWLDCTTRERNKGLFTADQNVGNEARSTRQNPGGGRSGYECAEERDYWPYWHPQYWTDIAVLSMNTTACEIDAQQSQNVVEKGTCSTVTDNNPISCAQNGGTWEVTPAFGKAAPVCAASPWSRGNIHGNSIQPGTGGMEQAHWNYSVDATDDADNDKCILRLRYNQTPGEIPRTLTAANNDAASPVQNDPLIDIGTGIELQLNLNTAQTGRTFEDRSHVFQVLNRPDNVAKDATIFNVNVRGKRGNNGATYPNNEYDVHPTNVRARANDVIHYQWTGSNNNPNGNDRNNILQFQAQKYNYPLMMADVNMFENEDQLRSAAHSCGSTDANLQDVQPYCDVGLVAMGTPGVYEYFGVKNNAWTNRDQKATIVVEDAPLSDGAIVGIVVGCLAAVGGGAGAAVLYKKKFSSAAPGVQGRF